MGEQRRKAAAGVTFETRRAQVDQAARLVSAAIQKLATAASASIGGDCYLHAELGRVLLADLGIIGRVTFGFAAWRVGPGDGDVISHTSQEQAYCPPGVRGYPYHVWLTVDNFVLDFTTYQLPLKAKMLDELDHGATSVEWAPPYLLLSSKEVKTYRAVAQAPNPGHAHYEERYGLRPLLNPRPIEADDIAAARLILQNEQIVVVGPNTFAT